MTSLAKTNGGRVHAGRTYADKGSSSAVAVAVDGEGVNIYGVGAYDRLVCSYATAPSTRFDCPPVARLNPRQTFASYRVKGASEIVGWLGDQKTIRKIDGRTSALYLGDGELTVVLRSGRTLAFDLALTTSREVSPTLPHPVKCSAVGWRCCCDDRHVYTYGARNRTIPLRNADKLDSRRLAINRRGHLAVLCDGLRVYRSGKLVRYDVRGETVAWAGDWHVVVDSTIIDVKHGAVTKREVAGQLVCADPLLHYDDSQIWLSEQIDTSEPSLAAAMTSLSVSRPTNGHQDPLTTSPTIVIEQARQNTKQLARHTAPILARHADAMVVAALKTQLTPAEMELWLLTLGESLSSGDPAVATLVTNLYDALGVAHVAFSRDCHALNTILARVVARLAEECEQATHAQYSLETLISLARQQQPVKPQQQYKKEQQQDRQVGKYTIDRLEL